LKKNDEDVEGLLHRTGMRFLYLLSISPFVYGFFRARSPNKEVKVIPESTQRTGWNSSLQRENEMKRTQMCLATRLPFFLQISVQNSECVVADV